MEFSKFMLKLFVMGIILLQIASAAEFASDYCSFRCKNGEFHTMCKFQGQSRYCRKFVHLNYVKEKSKLLKYHNELRNAFAGARANYNHPSAANMMLMILGIAFQYWDPELEMSALSWAQQCTASTERDSCRDLPRFRAGQNIALMEGDNLKALKRIPVRRLFRQWVEQWGSLEVSTIARYSKNGPDVSELTQALWATTTRVGCADVIYSVADGKFVRQLVCNYGPAGNILTEPVYSIGNPCSACPPGAECILGRLPHLCVRPK